jgi:hypothetical protein
MKKPNKNDIETGTYVSIQNYGIGKITSFWEGPREGIYASIKLLNKSGLPVYLAKKDLVKATDEEIVWALLQL